jgi:pyridoxamine 5'-phosphate oxidase-like protein
VSGGRSVEERRSDALEVLARSGEAWLATGGPDGRPQLIAVSTWWDGRHVVIATIGRLRTARNLDSSGLARLAFGTPGDVVMVDARVADSVAAGEAAPELRAGFIGAAGWDPGEEGADWRYYRLLPVQVQAYRGYGELTGRQVMRDGQWLGQ